MSEALKTILDNLNAIFRHVVPGGLALGIVRLSNPSWFFRNFPMHDAGDIWFMIGCAFIAGNALYALHRNTVHILVDWIACSIVAGWKPYTSVVAEMIAHHDKSSETVRNVSYGRVSHLMVTWMTGELIVVGILTSDAQSFIGRNSCLLFVVALVLLIAAFIAQIVSLSVSRKLAELQQQTKIPGKPVR